MSYAGLPRSNLNPAQPSASETYKSIGLKIVTHCMTNFTPSGGLLRALRFTKSFWSIIDNAILACSRAGIAASKISLAYLFCSSIFAELTSRSFYLIAALSFLTVTISVVSVTSLRITST